MNRKNPWDDVWKDYPSSGPLHSIGEFLARWGELKRLIFHEVSGAGVSPSQGPVLEAGCGTGTVISLMARRGYRVTGIDLSLPALAHARSHTRRLAAARVESLPFPDRAFSLVYSAGVFDLLSEEDLTTAVGEALRVVGSGGRVVLVNAAPCRIHRWVMARLKRRNRWRYGPKREVLSLRETVLGHRPDAVVVEHGRGFVQRLRFLVYLVEHRPVLRRLAHGMFLVASALLWPLDRLPGAVLVTRVELP